MRLHHLALPLLLLASGSIPAAGRLPVHQRVYITVEYRNRADLQRVASRFEHPRVDRTAKTISVEAKVDDVYVLRREGFVVNVDQDRSAQLQRLQSALEKSGSLKSIPEFACYRTVEETYESMDDLVRRHPKLASISDIGPSWKKTRNPTEGYDMRVLKLTNARTDARLPDKPTMVVLGSIHSREYPSAELATRFAEWLANGYGTNDEATWLMDNFAFQFVLQANPDGRKMAENGLYWRKNLNNTNGTCRFEDDYGTDLNRNFPFNWSGRLAGRNQCDETYLGPFAASEPETKNLMRLIAGTRDASGVYTGGVFRDRRADGYSAAAPDDYQGIFIDIHNNAQSVWWPWSDRTTSAPNDAALQALGRRIAYHNGYSAEESSAGYVLVTGSTDDNMYGLLGVPAYTIEVGGNGFFADCRSFRNTILPDNLQALRQAARSLYAPYKLPAGPNTATISVSSRRVPAGASVDIRANVDDSAFGRSQLPGAPVDVVQNITSAKAYLDTPPWDPNAIPIPLAAVDGRFDSSTEDVAGTISTRGLKNGMHTVFVQGTDASNAKGTPKAVRFRVVPTTMHSSSP